MAAGEPITAARVIRYLSCYEDRLYHGGKRASMSTVAARLLLVIGVPGGLWSCPGWVCGHLLGLRSLSGSWSVVMSWEVLWSCPGSVVISWVCVHFLDRGLWSCPGWVCGHLLGLWSFPDSWSVVMSWVGLWSSPGSVMSVIISWLVVCGHILVGSVVIFWFCGHLLGRGLWSCPGWVCGHLQW